MATYLLSPGHFHDRLREAAATWVSAPLSDHPEVARLVLDRFASRLRGSRRSTPAAQAVAAAVVRSSGSSTSRRMILPLAPFGSSGCSQT